MQEPSQTGHYIYIGWTPISKAIYTLTQQSLGVHPLTEKHEWFQWMRTEQKHKQCCCLVSGATTAKTSPREGGSEFSCKGTSTHWEEAISTSKSSWYTHIAPAKPGPSHPRSSWNKTTAVQISDYNSLSSTTDTIWLPIKKWKRNAMQYWSN